MNTHDTAQQIAETIRHLCNTDNDAPRLIREALHDFHMKHLPDVGWRTPEEAEALLDELAAAESESTRINGELNEATEEIDELKDTISDKNDKINDLTKQVTELVSKVVYLEDALNAANDR